ncbi:MAG: MOMP family protein [Verrucomicrobia bacterium]|nr:MOMP family protein [Verrucomicrobiota bacterium]
MMKAALFTTIGVCLSVITFADAQDLESRISNLEARMASISTQTALGSRGARMASAAPQIDSYGYYVTADFLYWNLTEGGTDYALTDKKTPGDIPFKGKSKKIEFDWDPGFRVGVGYQLDEHDGWDGLLNFTWFQTEESSHAHAPSEGALVPLWGFPFSNVAEKAKASWEFDFYTLDFELGRRYFVSKYLSVRPEFGLKSAWIYQHVKASFLEITPSRTGNVQIRRKNNFWGIGPRAGVDATWFFDSHFSFFGTGSAALLWGDFDVREKEQETIAHRKLINFNADFNAIVPTAQLLLGFQWEANFNDARNHFKILLGYEFQYWWRQNQMLEFENEGSFNPDRYSEDVSLQGLTLDVRFDF